jgi:hypothetical protein
MEKKMKKFYAILVAVAVCGFGFSALNAADAKAAPAKTKPVAVKEVKINGTVTAVDAAQSTVTVKTKKADETFKIDETTKITLKKKPATIADLKAGQTVKITAKEGVASKIDVIK